MAEEFATTNYFSGTRSELASKIIKPLEATQSGNVNASFIFLEPTTIKEVQETIKSLKKNKAPGIDCVTADTLKEVADIKKQLLYAILLI